ncbi:hypothetical protein ACLGAS_06115 [Helicobacter pylori]
MGDEDYNKLTSREFWEKASKEWSKEEIDKFKQDLDPLYQKIQKKYGQPIFKNIKSLL